MADIIANNSCGTGGWAGPRPGDPDNNVTVLAAAAFGGIDVTWSYPAINPYAIAYIDLYRATENNVFQSRKIATVGGNFYYDKVNTDQIYYYWIQIMSINGTLAATVGPASAKARPLINDLIVELTAKIDSGLLGQNLKRDIDKITTNYGELTAEIAARIASNKALSNALKNVQSGVDQSLAFIDQEIITRQDGDSALASRITTVAAANRDNIALIQKEELARVTADGLLVLDIGAVLGQTKTVAGKIDDERLLRIKGDDAIALTVDGVSLANRTVAASVLNVETAKIGYSALNNGLSTPYDGDNVTIVYPDHLYPAATFQEYKDNRKRIIDKVGVDNWNATPAGQLKPLIWLRGLPLASAVKQVGVTGPDGNYASLETSLVAQKDLNGKYNAIYSAKVNVNGLIGGFSLVNDGVTVDAGFDVDTFYVGRTNANKRKPFIIVNNETFIDEAVINQLTFNKLRDQSGSFIVVDGKVKADYLDTKGLIIRDATGKPIFGSGTNITLDYITGLGTLATKSTLTTTDINGLGTLATRSSLSTVDVSGLGTLATRSSLSTVDVSGLGTLATANSVDWTTVVARPTTLAGLDLAAANQLDKKSVTYYQPSQPTGLGSNDIGDIWFDTDEAFKMYTWTGSIWIVVQDSAAASLAASTAQGTADKKITTYYATSAPTTTVIGDLWYNTSTKLLNRWTGNAWLVVSNSYTNSTEFIDGAGWATTADWVKVTGTGKPSDYADKTSLNTAARITGQGALATTDNVFIGSNVRFGDGTVMNTADFINKLQKIDANNISTFMASAAIGTAYIGNAAIGSAQIQDLSVSTLKIEGEAVTIPRYTSGIYYAGIGFTAPVAAFYTVLGIWTQGTDRNNSRVGLYCNNVLKTTEIPIAGTLGAMTFGIHLAAGYHSFELDANTKSGDMRCSLIVLGAKK